MICITALTNNGERRFTLLATCRLNCHTWVLRRQNRQPHASLASPTSALQDLDLKLKLALIFRPNKVEG